MTATSIQRETDALFLADTLLKKEAVAPPGDRERTRRNADDARNCRQHDRFEVTTRQTHQVTDSVEWSVLPENPAVSSHYGGDDRSHQRRVCQPIRRLGFTVAR